MKNNYLFITSSSGSKSTSDNYDPSGNIRSVTGIPDYFQFNAQQLDEESNMYFLRARYYDPSTGRFISKDPVKGGLSNPQTQNPYAYALNNPNSFSDPSGELVAGLCVNANLGFAAFGSCSVCAVITSNREIGVIGSFGGGGSTGLATGVGPQVLFSKKANSLKDMEGQDIFAGGSSQVFGGDVSWSKSDPSMRTYTFGPSIGPDISLPLLPGEAHGGSVYNWSAPYPIKF